MNGGTEMDVREKLVELLTDNLPRIGNLPKCDNPLQYTIDEIVERIADHLIMNGVTVQEWISVKDRLPKIPDGYAENPEPVLYMMKNDKTIYAGYYGEGGIWRDKYFRQYSDSHEWVDANDVLWWMYQHDLPQPPKGE